MIWFFVDFINIGVCPVSGDSRIHQLHLCREVRPPPSRTGILDMTLNHLIVLEYVEYPFIAITPKSTLTWNGRIC